MATLRPLLPQGLAAGCPTAANCSTVGSASACGAAGRLATSVDHQLCSVEDLTTTALVASQLRHRRVVVLALMITAGSLVQGRECCCWPPAGLCILQGRGCMLLLLLLLLMAVMKAKPHARRPTQPPQEPKEPSARQQQLE